MNKSDITDVLSAIAVGDRRTVGDTDIEFWFATIGDLRKDLAMAAVRDHFREEPGVWLEPGHIVKRVRAILADTVARDPDYHQVEDGADTYHPGDLRAAPDPPDYPQEWASDQRISAYWYALKLRVTPTTTNGWRALLDQLEQCRRKRAAALETTTTKGH